MAQNAERDKKQGYEKSAKNSNFRKKLPLFSPFSSSLTEDKVAENFRAFRGKNFGKIDRMTRTCRQNLAAENWIPANGRSRAKLPEFVAFG